MTIFLREDLAGRLVREIYGGYDELAAAWEDQTANGSDLPKARQRSSLYRWVTHGVPTRRDGTDHKFFVLCGLLDVDPLAIFDFHRNGYFSKFARIRQLIYYGRQALGGVATMLDMYRPADTWPSNSIAQTCFAHGWYLHHLTNQDNWDNSDYILLKVRFTDNRISHPRAVHVAYRRFGVPDTMWRYYGSVLAIDGRLELYNESGTYQTMDQVHDNEVRFRTYFGGRPVEWRIASLHEFSLHTEYPSNDTEIIGFTW
jgi:hypothetical protein